jgi:hypothetical protein
MIWLVPLLFLGAGAVVLTVFWEEIRDWVKSVWEDIKVRFKPVVSGVKIFVRKMREAFKEIVKHWHQDKQGQWHETTVTKQVDESQVPPEIRAMAKKQEVDVEITDQFKDQLELAH